MAFATYQLSVAALGLISWPLLEYGLHRFILHGIKPFSTWHAKHHRSDRCGARHDPDASWRVVGMLLVLGLASFGAGGSIDALEMSLSAGLLAGFGLYVFVHHAIHHCQCDNAWLRQRKFCHALHHDPSLPAGYYGVTSDLWDTVLRTRHRHEF